VKKNNRKGFTITELVIVIAVIAILAAVLIPTFSGIVNKANDSADLQEARSIMTQYIASKDGKVKGVYYIQVGEGNDAVYFKVENGQINKTPVATAVATAEGNTVVSKDITTDNDEWPEETVIPTTP